VVKHEVIHLRKNHLLQRFALAWAMSLLVLVTLSAALGLAAWLPKEQAGPILPAFSLFLGVALVWGSIRAIQEQSRLHELEADLLCITELGARASALESALRKAERINGAATSKSHPGLAARLEALEPLLRQEKAQNQESQRTQRAA
jgi:Zn-dependent protease with chaperone function